MYFLFPGYANYYFIVCGSSESYPEGLSQFYVFLETLQNSLLCSHLEKTTKLDVTLAFQMLRSSCAHRVLQRFMMKTQRLLPNGSVVGDFLLRRLQK